MKKIGILGSGSVGKVLASGFLGHGYEVVIGTRDTTKLDEWKEKNPGAKVGSFADAAAFGDIIVLAVKGLVAKDALLLAGKKNIAGKVIMDATNPIAATPPVNGVLSFFSRLDGSLMEDLQAYFPTSSFVKVFNSVGSARMVNPEYGGIRPSMFICGNDDKAKIEVKRILDIFGWETEDMGNVEAARAIEPLCMLWCIPGFLRNEWTHAFKLLK